MSNRNRIVVSCVIFLAFIMPACNLINKESIEEKAARIHDNVLTVDSHVDTPMRLTHSGFDIGKAHSVVDERSRVDFPRMKEGGLDAVFFAIFNQSLSDKF